MFDTIPIGAPSTGALDVFATTAEKRFAHANSISAQDTHGKVIYFLGQTMDRVIYVYFRAIFRVNLQAKYLLQYP